MAAAAKRDDLPHLRRRGGLGGALRGAVRACGQRAGRGRALVPDDTQVHDARRALKRARAILHLGEAMGVARAKTTRRRLARLARALSPWRDAAVVLRLAERSATQGSGATRAGLGEMQVGKGRAPDARQWAAWTRSLAAEMRRAGELAWGEPTPRDVDRALRRSARRIRKWARRAQVGSGITAAHEWRKAVIVLREQLLVARPLLGAEAGSVLARLQQLARLLGTVMDWHVFVEDVRDRGWPPELWEARTCLADLGRAERKRAFLRARKYWWDVRPELTGVFG